MYNAVKSDVNKVDISANEGPASTKAQDHVSNNTQLGLAGGTEPIPVFRGTVLGIVTQFRAHGR